MLVVRQLMRRPLRNMRGYRNLVLGCTVITALFIVDYYNSVSPTFLGMFASPWKKQSVSKPIRPRAFYPWIGDAGQTLNGTKPPVYGVFVLIDLDLLTTRGTSSRQDDDSFIERLTDHDFGFSSCHQVTKKNFIGLNYRVGLQYKLLYSAVRAIPGDLFYSRQNYFHSSFISIHSFLFFFIFSYLSVSISFLSLLFPWCASLLSS